MMLGLVGAKALLGYLTIFLAYLATIGPVGYFRSWVAKKMGDETAEELGFLTCNPLVHIDSFGLLVLLLFARPEYFSGFGWGRHVPINPNNIGGRWRWLKMSCAFFSDAFAHFILAAFGLIVMSIITGTSGQSSLMLLAQQSSFSVVLLQLTVAFVSLNIALVLVQFVINLVVMFALYAVEGNWQLGSYLYFILFLAPVVIVFLFGSELSRLILYGVAAIERAITSLL